LKLFIGFLYPKHRIPFVNNLKIQIVKNQKEFDDVIAIRKKVFIGEQNVPTDIEIDGLDDEAGHVIAYLDNKSIGCARIRMNNFAKLERIAVMRDHRGKGFGRKITEFLIDYCKQKNVDEIQLHAQIYTADFYKKLGFLERGKTFFEADIEHIEMYMKI